MQSGHSACVLPEKVDGPDKLPAKYALRSSANGPNRFRAVLWDVEGRDGLPSHTITAGPGRTVRMASHPALLCYRTFALIPEASTMPPVLCAQGPMAPQTIP